MRNHHLVVSITFLLHDSPFAMNLHAVIFRLDLGFVYFCSFERAWFDLISYRIIEISYRKYRHRILLIIAREQFLRKNKKFELNILDFEPLVAKVGNPSEGLMQSNLKYSMRICGICLVFQVYSRYIVHKVCFNLLSRLLYRFSIIHIFHIPYFVICV